MQVTSCAKEAGSERAGNTIIQKACTLPIVMKTAGLQISSALTSYAFGLGVETFLGEEHCLVSQIETKRDRERKIETLFIFRLFIFRLVVFLSYL